MANRRIQGGDVRATMTTKLTVRTLYYSDQELEPGDDEECIDVELDIAGYRNDYYPVTSSSPEEGGDIEDVEATYAGQRVHLSPPDERRAREILALVETIDEYEPDTESITVMGFRL